MTDPHIDDPHEEIAEQADEVAVMTEWQPIDTAPKDGSWILLLHGETIPGVPLVEVASFGDGLSAEELGYREFAKYGAWVIWNASDNWYLVDVAEPTHWMPLPPPPRAAEAEDRALSRMGPL